MRGVDVPEPYLLQEFPLALKLVLLAGLILSGWVGIAIAVAWLASSMR